MTQTFSHTSQFLQEEGEKVRNFTSVFDPGEPVCFRNKAMCPKSKMKSVATTINYSMSCPNLVQLGLLLPKTLGLIGGPMKHGPGNLFSCQ